MDLGAYAQIEDFNKVMNDNGISVPRLRGLRLMSKESPFAENDIAEWAKHIGLENCEFACRAYFEWGDYGHLYSSGTNKMVKKYLITDNDGCLSDVNWKNIHGKKRKRFKYELKQAYKRVTKNTSVFNKYIGRNDVLYIHARIGGCNWLYYGGSEIAKEPWFLEKVDDPFDSTYCDIYAKIDPSTLPVMDATD